MTTTRAARHLMSSDHCSQRRRRPRQRQRRQRPSNRLRPDGDLGSRRTSHATYLVWTHHSSSHPGRQSHMRRNRLLAKRQAASTTAHPPMEPSMINIATTILKMTRTHLQVPVLTVLNVLDFDWHMRVIDVGNVRFDVIRIIHVDHAKRPRMNVLSIHLLEDLRSRNLANRGQILPPDSNDLIHQSKIRRHWRRD